MSQKIILPDNDIIENEHHQYILSFAYDGYAYYVDSNEWEDSENTVACSCFTHECIYGMTANQMLDRSVKAYLADGGEVWMSEYFKGSILLCYEQ